MAKAETKKKPGIFRRIVNYFKDLKSEIKKVVWPSKQTVFRSAVVVFVMLLIVGVFVVLIDLLFTTLLGLLVGNAA